MNVQLDISACKKKHAVLLSTLELIKEHGFHGTSMSQIAKNANVAAGTIYHYFESKDALIKELYIYVKERLAQAIIDNDNENDSYKERFIKFWISQCNFYIENESSMVFLEQYINSPYHKFYPGDAGELFKSHVVTFFHQGINEGHLKAIDHELLSPLIRGSIVSAAKYHLAGNYDFTTDKLYEMALVIWDGIRKQS